MYAQKQIGGGQTDSAVGLTCVGQAKKAKVGQEVVVRVRIGMEMGQAMMFSHNTHQKGLCDYSKNSVIGKYGF